MQVESGETERKDHDKYLSLNEGKLERLQGNTGSGKQERIQLWLKGGQSQGRLLSSGRLFQVCVA